MSLESAPAWLWAALVFSVLFLLQSDANFISRATSRFLVRVAALVRPGDTERWRNEWLRELIEKQEADNCSGFIWASGYVLTSGAVRSWHTTRSAARAGARVLALGSAIVDASRRVSLGGSKARALLGGVAVIAILAVVMSEVTGSGTKDSGLSGPVGMIGAGLALLAAAVTWSARLRWREDARIDAERDARVRELKELRTRVVYLDGNVEKRIYRVVDPDSFEVTFWAEGRSPDEDGDE